jgi:hypothetical protein
LSSSSSSLCAYGHWFFLLAFALLLSLFFLVFLSTLSPLPVSASPSLLTHSRPVVSLSSLFSPQAAVSLPSPPSPSPLLLYSRPAAGRHLDSYQKQKRLKTLWAEEEEVEREMRRMGKISAQLKAEQDQREQEERRQRTEEKQTEGKQTESKPPSPAVEQQKEHRPAAAEAAASPPSAPAPVDAKVETTRQLKPKLSVVDQAVHALKAKERKEERTPAAQPPAAEGAPAAAADKQPASNAAAEPREEETKRKRTVTHSEIRMVRARQPDGETEPDEQHEPAAEGSSRR